MRVPRRRLLGGRRCLPRPLVGSSKAGWPSHLRFYENTRRSFKLAMQAKKDPPPAAQVGVPPMAGAEPQRPGPADGPVAAEAAAEAAGAPLAPSAAAAADEGAASAASAVGVAPAAVQGEPAQRKRDKAGGDEGSPGDV